MDLDIGFADDFIGSHVVKLENIPEAGLGLWGSCETGLGRIPGGRAREPLMQPVGL